LFGRKILFAEAPIEIVSLMREVVARSITVEEAVKAYHGVLQNKGIKPGRSLVDDLQLTEQPLKLAA
jgi:hypothetical protein